MNSDLKGIVQTISPSDEMYEERDTGAAHYFRVGFSAMNVITNALMLAEKQDVKKIMDFACGHGRVLRMLRRAFPDATIYACDINRAGVDFCARTFDAVPVYSSVMLSEVRLSESFDLIWAGSLFTHLAAKPFEECFQFCTDHLNNGGLFVFSVHGRHSIWRQNHDYHYIDGERFRVIQQEYERIGFGYADYEDQPGYGISIAKPSWVLSLVERFADISVVVFRERAWDDHQDIVACMKRPVPSGAVDLDQSSLDLAV
ncbi:MAG: class I SAM-dependent methyltransferase [Thermomicrobiales bacterium]